MSVKILFFGSVADRLGKRACQLEISKPVTLAHVVEAVGCQEFQPLLVAVNQEQISDMNLMVNSRDEVALMPPFSGG